MVKRQLSRTGGATLPNTISRRDRHLIAVRRPRIKFKLLGHGCPYGAYPSPVIPIGVIAGKLVAIYPGGKSGPTIQSLEEDSVYAHHSDDLSKDLQGFDYRGDRLFAYTSAHVIKYNAGEERQFLLKFLEEEAATCAPGIRRMLERVACR